MLSSSERTWREGISFKCPATVAYNEITAIGAKLGKPHDMVEAEDIVRFAKSKRSPLHDDFEWDDSVAGHEYRLQTARTIAGSIIEVNEKTSPPREMRSFVAVRLPDSPKGRPKFGYARVEDAMKDEDVREEVLARAKRELMALRKRYQDLQELAEVMRAIDHVLDGAEVVAT